MVIAILVAALSKQNLSTPGLYYDEAVSGGLAKDFITGHAQPHMSNVQLWNISGRGRPFPFFVQSYYGALKSWLLIPPIAVWGATLAILRLTSLACALLALLFLVLAVRLWLGLPAAMTWLTWTPRAVMIRRKSKLIGTSKVKSCFIRFDFGNNEPELRSKFISSLH